MFVYYKRSIFGAIFWQRLDHESASLGTKQLRSPTFASASPEGEEESKVVFAGGGVTASCRHRHR